MILYQLVFMKGAHNCWPLVSPLSSYSDANKIIPNFCSTTVSLILSTLYWFNWFIYRDRVVPSALYLYIFMSNK